MSVITVDIQAHGGGVVAGRLPDYEYEFIYRKDCGNLALLFDASELEDYYPYPDMEESVRNVVESAGHDWFGRVIACGQDTIYAAFKEDRDEWYYAFDVGSSDITTLVCCNCPSDGPICGVGEGGASAEVDR